MVKVKVAAIQFDSKTGQKRQNLDKAIELLESAGKQEVNMAAIPDYFLTGYPLTKENVAKGAEPIPGPTTDELSKVAEKYKMYILGGGIIERDSDKLYSTCPILGPDGKMIGKYRKVNFWMLPPNDEVGVGLTPGTEHLVFKTEFGIVAPFLQVDIDFPEHPRVLALKGAEILFWMTGVDYSWIDLCRVLTSAIAFNNMCYVVTVNRTGVQDNSIYFGASSIINPMGEILASAGQSYGAFFPEGMAVATIDTELVRQMRRQFNPFGRRKPETFRILTEGR